MRNFVHIIVGVLFGIVMVKSEAASWFRIQEMFRFQSFHMYGIICSAIAVGLVSMQLLKRRNLRDIDGELIQPKPKAKFYKATILVGIIFGIGWAFTCACPGPLFVNFGAGYTVMVVPILASVVGAFAHGMLKKYLPH